MLEEPAQRLVGRLLGYVLPAFPRPAGDVAGVILPHGEHVAMDDAGMRARAPDGEKRRRHLVARFEIRSVQLEIARGAGAVILATAANRFPSEAADIFGEGFGGEEFEADAGLGELALHEP